MTIVREVREEEKGEYQKVVSHITQSWEWGEFREKTGVKVVRLGEFQKTKLISACQIFFHHIPHTNFNIGYLPRSPLPNDQIINSIREIGQKNNCVFIKIESDLLQSPQTPQIPQPYVKGKPILPIHTFILDLTQAEEDLLKKMHEKTRYNIRLAQKHNLRVEEKEDQQSLKIFLGFLEETEKRQGFYTHPANYFLKQWQILKPAGMIHLLLAYHQKTPLAGLLLLQFKDQLYYTYGGSSEIHREKMPNHLLHWEAIKLGKKLGCKTYDLWGAYLEKPEPSDPWYGIYRFKAGFGGELINYPGAYDLVLQPQLYKLYRVVDFLRWKFLKIKRVSRFHLCQGGTL